jgi:hypothetical protein
LNQPDAEALPPPDVQPDLDEGEAEHVYVPQEEPPAEYNNDFDNNLEDDRANDTFGKKNTTTSKYLYFLNNH